MRLVLHCRYSKRVRKRLMRRNMTKQHLETQIMFLMGTKRSLVAPGSELEGSGAHPAPHGPMLPCSMGAGAILLCRIRVVSLEQDLHPSEVFISVEICARKAFSFAGQAQGQRQSSPLPESWGWKEPCSPASCSRCFAGCVEGSRHY